jgi:hypothetical protein
MNTKHTRYKKSTLLLCGLLAAALLTGCGQNKAAAHADSTAEAATAEYAVEANSLDTWQTQLPQTTTEPVGVKAVRGIRVVRDGATVFAASYEPRDYKFTYDSWTISVPYDSLVYADSEALQNYFENCAALTLTPCADAPADTGLDNAQTSVFVAYDSTQTDSSGNAAPDSAVLYRIGAKNAAGQYYVGTGADDTVSLADAAPIDALLGVDPYSCILKVVNVVRADTVSDVEIAMDGKTYTMAAADGKYQLNNKNVESGVYTDLFTKLMSLYIEKEIPAGEAAQGGTLLSLTYHRSVAGAPERTVSYRSFDDSYAAASVNGQEFFLVNKSDVETLKAELKKAF